MVTSAMFKEHYARFYDLFNEDKPYREEVQFVYKWAGRPQRIFDIGAGTGNYWKYYPKKVKLFGIEKSEAMIPKGKQIVCADITTYKHNGKFDCATALFDVINYIQRHDWWKNLPLESGGLFIFDIWDKEKVNKDGFNPRIKKIGDVERTITPLNYDGKSIDLDISVVEDGVRFSETHKMYVYSHEDIERFCGDEFEIVETKETKTWQKWFKLRRR